MKPSRAGGSGPGPHAGPSADTHALAELADEEGPQGGLLVVVLDVHVDHVHRLAGLLLPGVQVCPGQRARSGPCTAPPDLHTGPTSPGLGRPSEPRVPTPAPSVLLAAPAASPRRTGSAEAPGRGLPGCCLARRGRGRAAVRDSRDRGHHGPGTGGAPGLRAHLPPPGRTLSPRR